MEMIHRGIVVTTLVLGVAGLGACTTLAPLQQGVVLPFVSLEEDSEESWTVAHADSSGATKVSEFVRPHETVEDWTEMLTMMSFEKVTTINGLLSSFEAETVARCPGSTFAVHERLEDGVLFEASLVNCETGPKEEMVGRVLDGASQHFVVQYAVREPVEMSAERRDEWFDNLRQVSLINTR